MKPVIETHDLCKSYNGRTVVDHLNLTVPQGCVYGFLGPNGAGKSTSMKMLLGLVHPTGGSVELLGHTMNETNRLPLLRQTGSLSFALAFTRTKPKAHVQLPTERITIG